MTTIEDQQRDEYMKDYANCMEYYKEDIKKHTEALKMIIKSINQQGHNVDVCELFDIY